MHLLLSRYSIAEVWLDEVHPIDADILDLNYQTENFFKKDVSYIHHIKCSAQQNLTLQQTPDGGNILCLSQRISL